MDKLKINLRRDIALFQRTLAFIWDCSKTLTIIRLCLIFVQSILPLIPLYLIKLLIDQIAADVSQGIQDAWWILICFGAVQLLTILVNNYAKYVTGLQADRVSIHMSRLVLNKSIELDLDHYDSNEYHNIYFRAQNEAGQRPIALLNAITDLAKQAMMLIALAGLLMTLHWAIGLLMIIIVIPIAFVQLKFTKRFYVWKESSTPTERKVNYLSRVLNTIPYAKEVRLFGFGSRIIDKYEGLRNQLFDEKKEISKKQNVSLSFVQSIEALATIGVLVFIVIRAVSGVISIGDIIMYFQAFQKGQSSIHSMLNSGVSLYQNRLFLEHIFRFFELQPSIPKSQSTNPIDKSISSIKTKDVHFKYPGTSETVLEQIDLEFKKGKLIALVGENGSGKTTLVKLLTRLYDPTQGLVEINGNNIKDYSVSDVRNQMTVIFQDFAQYSFTVAENIAISESLDNIDMDRVKESAKLSGANEFIDTLPDQYNTQLGKIFRNGIELSGGQWQKIALARAFYRDADVIILDEPTSFIDPLAEGEIFSSLKKLAEDKILILVTHRLYNLKMADEIIVLDNGRIFEKGSHIELFDQKGKYYEMFSNQS